MKPSLMVGSSIPRSIAAEPVFKLLGRRGLETEKMPEAGQFVGNTLAFYMHDGGHGTIPSDWEQFMKFMEMHFKQ